LEVFLLVFVFPYFLPKHLYLYLYLHSKKSKYTSLHIPLGVRLPIVRAGVALRGSTIVAVALTTSRAAPRTPVAGHAAPAATAAAAAAAAAREAAQVGAGRLGPAVADDLVDGQLEGD